MNKLVVGPDQFIETELDPQYIRVEWGFDSTVKAYVCKLYYDNRESSRHYGWTVCIAPHAVEQAAYPFMMHQLTKGVRHLEEFANARGR